MARTRGGLRVSDSGGAGGRRALREVSRARRARARRPRRRAATRRWLTSRGALRDEPVTIRYVPRGLRPWLRVSERDPLGGGAPRPSAVSAGAGRLAATRPLPRKSSRNSPPDPCVEPVANLAREVSRAKGRCVPAL